MQSSRRRFMRGMLVTVIIMGGLSAYFFIKHVPSNLMMSRSMPIIMIFDIRGRSYNSKEFPGKMVFIQFVDARNSGEIAFMNEFIENWKDENIVILNMLSHRSQGPIAMVRDNNLFYYDCDNRTRDLFDIPNRGSRQLYNEKGIIILSIRGGIRYEEARRSLNKVIKGKIFSLSQIVRIGESVHNLAEFQQVADYIVSQKKAKYIVVLFSSICNNCASGSIIRYLSDLEKARGGQIGIICLLGIHYMDKDILSVKSQLNTNISVYIANSSLSARWNYLTKEFSEADMNGTIFIVSNGGIIERGYSPTCSNCIQEMKNDLAMELVQI